MVGMGRVMGSFLGLMKQFHVKRALHYRFDFEIGHLVKSPCKGCGEREEFPRCIDRCEILDKIHDILAESISCTKG